MKKFGTVGIIGRFKPFHLGGLAVLEALCECSEIVKIGIGSANMYDARNPFTAEESEEMILFSLPTSCYNYTFLHLTDFGHLPEYRDGQKWRLHIKEKFGNLEALFSGNAYVHELLKDDYNILPAYNLLPEEKRLPIKGSMVRFEIAKGADTWKALVPTAVAKYLEEKKLIERFQKEFGLQTLASVLEKDLRKSETREQEYAKITGDKK